MLTGLVYILLVASHISTNKLGGQGRRNNWGMQEVGWLALDHIGTPAIGVNLQ